MIIARPPETFVWWLTAEAALQRTACSLFTYRPAAATIRNVNSFDHSTHSLRLVELAGNLRADVALAGARLASCRGVDDKSQVDQRANKIELVDKPSPPPPP